MAPIASEVKSQRWGASIVESPPFESIPKKVTGPWVFSGPELEKQPEKWSYRLSSEDVAEVSDAADAFLSSGKALKDMTAEDFPLPKLSKKLAEVRSTLLDGVGFYMMKGFPVNDWNREKQIAVYMGVVAYFGDRVHQNGKGGRLRQRRRRCERNETNGSCFGRTGHVLGHIKRFVWVVPCSKSNLTD
jgi:hypothetical protein